MGDARSKLEAARSLLGKGRVLPALGLILEVHEESPGELDPTLAATVPLWEAVFREMVGRPNELAEFTRKISKVS